MAKKEDASSLFVSCKYPRTITNPHPVPVGQQPESFHMPAGYIGPVPDWVRNHWYFAALCRDGTVTTVVNTSSSAQEVAAAKAAEAEAAARLLQEKNVKIKEAQESARLQAEADAAADGLDQTSRKKLIAEREAAAKAAVEAEYETK